MKNHSSEEIQAIEIPPPNPPIIRHIAKATNETAQKEETTEAKEINDKKETKEEKEFKRLLHEMLDDDMVEGVLEPPTENKEEKVKIEEPPKKVNTIVHKEKPKEKPKEIVEIKQIKKTVIKQKTKPEESPEEQEKRLYNEFLDELNEDCEIGVLQASGQDSRSSSKVSGKKEAVQKTSKYPLKK